MSRVGRKHETIAGFERDAAAVGEGEVDRTARAVEQLRVGMLVFSVSVGRTVGPSVHVLRLASHARRQRCGIGRRSDMTAMLQVHVCHDAAVRVGVVFPHQEIGSDSARIIAFAQAAEDLGYAHLVAYDHVIGAEPSGRPAWWKGAYTHRDPFHEPFVLFGLLAAVTKKLELAFGIVILPQRQTVLVAKQAATLDVLSSGRVRFGAGIERFRGYVREAGRDPGTVGVEGRVAATGTPDDWARRASAFRDMGMTHLELRTAGSKLPDLDAHIEAMRRFREVAPVF